MKKAPLFYTDINLALPSEFDNQQLAKILENRLNKLMDNDDIPIKWDSDYQQLVINDHQGLTITEFVL